MILAWTNRLPGATLTASAQEALLPVQNAVAAPIAKVWRSSGTSVYVDADLGADLSLREFVAAGVNLTTAATHRIQLSDTAAGNTDVLDTGTVSAGIASGYNKVYYSHASELTARYLRWTFSDASLSFIDIGYLFAGPGWTPSRNFAFGALPRWIDDAGQDAGEAAGGQLVFPSRPRYRVVDFALNANGPAEMLANAFEMDRLVGTSGYVLVRLDPDNYPQQLSLFGTLRRSTGLPWIRHNVMTKDFSVRDSL